MYILQYLAQLDLTQGGVVRAVIDMCTLLAGAGHNISLVTTDAADRPPEWSGLRGIEILEVEPWGIATLLRDGVWPEWRSQLESADVVHLHTPWEIANPYLAKSARQAGVPYVVSLHGMLDDWSMSQRVLKKRLYYLLRARGFLKGAAAIHCTATGELAQATKWISGAQGAVVPLLFDLTPFQSLPGPELARSRYGQIDLEKPRVLFLSRLHIKKGIEKLLDAIAMLHDRGTPCSLLIAGTGEDSYVRSLRERATRLGLDDDAHFLGHIGGDPKISIYEWADVFVLPTSQENFGLVLPEALACRTPVITTKGVDIWPELEESGGAVIVKPTAERLATAIQSLLEDRARLETMGERGRSWVFQRLAREVVVGEYVDLYQRVIVNNR